MSIIDRINQQTLLITNQETKKRLLKELTKEKKVIPIKFMTLEEFVSSYFFDVSIEGYLFLLEKEKKKVSIIEEEISQLIYIENNEYKSEKLNHLKLLVKELDEKSLLERNTLFKNSLKNYQIIIYNYDLDPFYKKLFESLSVIIEKEELKEFKKPVVYEFNDIEEEIGFVAADISKKLQEGISIGKIKILNLTEEYRYPLRRIFNLVHIPVETKEETKLNETRVGKVALDYIKTEDSLEQAFFKIKEEFKTNEQIALIVSILNQYINLNDNKENVIQLIENDFKKAKVASSHLKNKIECLSINQIEEGNYYYLLGFNKENIPKVYKDEDYLTDIEKCELGLYTSDDKNKLEKEKFKKFLLTTSNLTITYKLKSAFDTFNASLLIEEMGLKVERPKISYNYSNIYNQVILSRSLDKLNKYGVLEERLPSLYETYQKTPYMTFDNKFKGLDIEKLKNYLNHKLLLSYSSIDNFYKCEFRYYLTNILKVDPFESTFMTNIGTIFHNILEHSLDKNFNFEEFYNQQINQYSFTSSEKFLLNKLKEELKFDIEIIRKQKEYTLFDKELHEQKFYLPISNKDYLETTFMGVVDKIMLYEEYNHTYLAIIDYKTGHLPDNLNNIIHGIGMQLPIYLYLINRSKKFTSPKVVGIFLQKIIGEEIKRKIKNDYNTEKENSLKLVGYTLEDKEILEKLDETYEDSKMIKGLKITTSGGFYSYSKVLNEEKFDELQGIVERKIKEADEKIRKADFKINPKKIGKDLVGCKYCKYKDICFKKEEDIVNLKEYKRLSFLGGDINA